MAEGKTREMIHFSEMHPHTATPICMAPFNNRRDRRHITEKSAGGYETGRTFFIPKAEQQQAMNEPYRNPERHIIKAARAARKAARRG